MARPESWLSTGEAAEILGLSTRTLYKLIDQGQLPGYRIGRLIRLKRTDIEAFVESSRISPPVGAPGRRDGGERR